MFWAAVRFGPTGVSVLQIISTGGMLWATLNGGPVSMRNVLSLQLFLVVAEWAVARALGRRA
jgi:hypothetical protein